MIANQSGLQNTKRWDILSTSLYVTTSTDTKISVNNFLDVLSSDLIELKNTLTERIDITNNLLLDEKKRATTEESLINNRIDEIIMNNQESLVPLINRVSLIETKLNKIELILLNLVNLS